MAFAMSFSEAVQNVLNFKADITRTRHWKILETKYIRNLDIHICIYFICIYLYVYI